jgi:hypothetical protein
MKRARRRLSYANVVSTLALIVALAGGTVYAASTIGPKQIKKGAVRSRQIKDRQVKRQDIAGGSINSAKVSNDSLTGKDIREATLGLVPSAQDARTLNGLTERVVRSSISAESGTTQAIAQGGLTARLSCPGGTATLEIRGAAPGDAGVVSDTDSGFGGQFSSITSQTIATAAAPPDDDLGVATVRRVDGSVTYADFQLLSIANGLGTNNDCFLDGVVVIGK